MLYNICMGRKKSKQANVQQAAQPEAVFTNFQNLDLSKEDRLFEKLFGEAYNLGALDFSSFSANLSDALSANFAANSNATFDADLNANSSADESFRGVLQGLEQGFAQGQHSFSSAAFSGVISGAQVSENPQPPLNAQKVLADFFDILDYQRKQRGNLLGVFVDGEYSIGEQMRQQLLLLPKKFENLEDSTAWASAKLGSFVINFKVVFDISNTFCGAKLFVIETESDVDENVKHITLLDEVLQVYDYYFRDEMFKKWNIFRDEQQLEKIGVVQQYLEMQADDLRFGRELDELLSQLYLVRMLQFLNTLGEKGEKVRKEFAETVATRLQTQPAFSQEFAMQKMLLDNLLIEHDIFDEVAKSQEGLKILQAYSKPLQSMRERRTEVISENVKTTKSGEKTGTGAAEEDVKTKDGNGKTAGRNSGKSGGSGGGSKNDVNVKSFNMKDVTPMSIGGGVSIGLGGGRAPAARPNAPAPVLPQTNTRTAQNRTAGTGATVTGTAGGTTRGTTRTNAAQNTANQGAQNSAAAGRQPVAPAASQPSTQAAQQNQPAIQSTQSTQQSQSAQQQPAKGQDAFSMGGALAMAQALVADDENDSQLNMQQGGLSNINLPFDELNADGAAKPKAKQSEFERGL